MATISEETKRAVERDLREKWGEIGTRQIAALHGISQTSVRDIAKAAGLTAQTTARTNIKTASDLHKAQFAAMRERLKVRFAKEAEAALDDIHQGSVIAGIAMGEVVSRRISQTTAGDRQKLMTAAAIGMDKAKMLDQYDQSDDATDIAKVLRLLAGGKS